MRQYTLFSVFIILGLSLHLLQTETRANTFWYNTVGNIANTLLVGGTLSLLYNTLIKKAELKEMTKLLRIADSVAQSGLSQIIPDAKDYHFTTVLEESKTFAAILNDGQRWVGNNSPAIKKRFNTPGTITEFFLVNPDSPFCVVLAEKTSVELVYLQVKIKQTIKLIEDIYRESNREGILQIFLLKNFPTHTIFLADKKLMITPYQIASGRTVIPLFEYVLAKNKKLISHHFASDVEELRKESRPYLQSHNI